jgi:hypothetical protein
MVILYETDGRVSRGSVPRSDILVVGMVDTMFEALHPAGG